ncbi:MAG: hypothetical protein CMF96_11945 [Candidatus Marinimicrobia bacterium]|nr:hypothetical protein [Candidatus Neomarinimicrobiota bacterium]|tara:strand:+ start:3522 stop:4832 length:1311 start_codon:yes stop_codon:yes gene_type:complete
MKTNFIFTLTILIFCSCNLELPSTNNSYEEKLTVFSNIEIQQLKTDSLIMNIGTIYISLTAGLNQDIQKDSLYIKNANISMMYLNSQNQDVVINNCTESSNYICFEYNEDQNGYIIKNGPPINPNLGDTIHLQVSYQDYEITAKTKLPNDIIISSNDSSPYLCDGDELPVKTVNTDNFLPVFESLISFFFNEGIISFDNINELNPFDLINNLDSLNYTKYQEFIENLDDSLLSSIDLRDNGNCYIGSFASYPYFRINFESNSNTSINIINTALESERIKNTFEQGNNETGIDLNCNDIRGEGNSAGYYQNLFYDYACQYDATFDIFKIWKDDITFDEENRLRFTNPFVWLADTSPIPMMWLYFNYYGLQLINVQVVDEAYYEYFTGDPFVFNSQQNQFILPDSNINNGYGLFSSNLSKSFFIYANRHPENINEIMK